MSSRAAAALRRMFFVPWVQKAGAGGVAALDGDVATAPGGPDKNGAGRGGDRAGFMDGMRERGAARAR